MPEDLKLTNLVENHRLKEKSEEELLELILQSNNWSREESRLIDSAYRFTARLHEQDQYKGQPYIKHSMRVAARITAYLNIYNAEVVAAAILHDIVEDHAKEIAGEGVEDASNRKKIALERISTLYTPRIAELVAAVTNDPKPSEGPEEVTPEESLAKYLAKVQEATSTAEGWLIKFSDWCENGVGIIHGAQELTNEELESFQRKYGGVVLQTYEQRFREADIQSMLDWAAKGYVEYQLTQGKQRLYMPEHVR